MKNKTINLTDKHYIYFNLVCCLNKWQDFVFDMEAEYPNIIASKLSGTYVLLYFNSSAEIQNLKNKKTEDIYAKYTAGVPFQKVF